MAFNLQGITKVLILITQRRRNHVGLTLQLCEDCGRKQAARHGARWPEPHEHSATTRDKGLATTVRVLKDQDGACDHCQPEVELASADAIDVLCGALQQRARSL